MKLPELLCPVGNEDALHAAIEHGADAIYLGYAQFGARASATNFDDERLASAISLAHLHKVRVYVTVNTLLKDNEFKSLEGALHAINNAHADAVITQDLGVASYVKSNFPRLQLHASTQMALRNRFDVLFAKEFGFSRVVLARECTLSEMEDAAKTNTEIEVFVHGALCTSVSGQCLFSSMVGNRSGNRGRCAQPCRQTFNFNNKSAAFLSLKDLCLIEEVPALVKAGVHSLKIEGRLKHAAYVATVTDSYRRALDAVATGNDFNVQAAKTRLLQVFNRGGFTKGHALLDSSMLSEKRVSHEGLPIGKIVSLSNGFAKMQITSTLNDGDSLQLRGKKDFDMRYSGKETLLGDIATLRLRPGVRPAVGDSVSRLTDASLLEWAEPKPFAPIPITINAIIHEGKPLSLSMSDGDVSVCIEGESVASAQSKPLSYENASKQLLKLGDTPFLCEVNDLEISILGNPFVPVSLLNQIRRDAVEALIIKRCNHFFSSGQIEPTVVDKPSPHEKKKIFDGNSLIVQFNDASNAHALLRHGATHLWFDPPSYLYDALERAILQLPDGCFLSLSNNLPQRDLDIAEALINKHVSKLGGVVANSWGHFRIKTALPIIAGPGLPITNQYGMKCLMLTPAQAFVLWPEWTEFENQMLFPLALPAIEQVYAKQRIMQLNHCPVGNRSTCNRCKTENEAMGMKNAFMTDHVGHPYPIRRTTSSLGCILNLFNTTPTVLPKQSSYIPLIQFSNESHDEQVKIIESYTTTPEHIANLTGTQGHWRRAVE